MVRLPVVFVGRRRHRVRVRLIRRFSWLRATGRFPEGDVYRLWAGWVLVTVMVDCAPADLPGRFLEIGGQHGPWIPITAPCRGER